MLGRLVISRIAAATQTHRLFRAFTLGAQRYRHDESASVIPTFGLMALIMFMMIGAAVDMARWLNAREQTVAATDAAVLAAGRALQTNGGDSEAALAVARSFYENAVRNRLSVYSDTIDFVTDATGSSIETIGNVTIRTPFMGIGGTRELPLLKATGEENSKAVLAVGGNAETSIELSMMLDVSGSMGGSKISDLKIAATDLVDILVWDDQTEYTSKIAIVPFSGDVLPPSTLLSQIVDPSEPDYVQYTTGSGKKKKTYKYYKTSCVAERSGNEKYSDAAPGAGQWITREYTQNGTCAINSNAIVQPLSNSKSTLNTLIGNLQTGGYTAGHIGTAWAYYMLSPNWASILPDGSEPAAYGAAKTKKIAVLMTDGEYNSEHDVKGVPVDQSGAGASANGTSSSNQAKSICTQMKANGIEVYTVGFDLGGNQTAINTLSNCATDASHFYNSATGDDLRNAFRDIALKISSLYLSNTGR